MSAEGSETKTTPAIRTATCLDLDAIEQLIGGALEEPWTRQEIAYFLAHQTSYCRASWTDKAGQEKLVVSMLGLLVEGALDIVSIVTSPDFRRQGHARDLLLNCLNDSQVERVFLEVRADNTPAITLYQTLGFAMGRMRTRYYRDGSDAWEMAWSRF